MAGILSIRRQRAASSAVAFFEAHGEKISTGVADSFRPFYEEGEEPVDFQLVLTVACRLLKDRLQGVIDADKAKIDEEANDIIAYLELEEAGREVNAQLVFIRRMLTGFYGVDLANEVLATDGAAARYDQPELLWRQGEQTAERLRNTPFKEPRRTSSSFQFDPLALAGELEPAVVNLATAYKTVTVERRKLEDPVTKKAEALQTFDTDFRACLRLGVALALVAGLPNIAKRLRASLLDAPRRGSGSEEADSAAEPAEEPAATTGESESAKPEAGAPAPEVAD